MRASRRRILRTRLGSNPRIWTVFTDGRDMFSMKSSRFKSYYCTPSHRMADHIGEYRCDSSQKHLSELSILQCRSGTKGRVLAWLHTVARLLIPEPKTRHPDAVCTLVAQPQGAILAPSQPCVAVDHLGQTHHDIFASFHRPWRTHLWYRHKLLLILAIYQHCQ